MDEFILCIIPFKYLIVMYKNNTKIKFNKKIYINIDNL